MFWRDSVTVLPRPEPKRRPSKATIAGIASKYLLFRCSCTRLLGCRRAYLTSAGQVTKYLRFSGRLPHVPGGGGCRLLSRSARGAAACASTRPPPPTRAARSRRCPHCARPGASRRGAPLRGGARGGESQGPPSSRKRLLNSMPHPRFRCAEAAACRAVRAPCAARPRDRSPDTRRASEHGSSRFSTEEGTRTASLRRGERVLLCARLVVRVVDNELASRRQRAPMRQGLERRAPRHAAVSEAASRRREQQ